MAVRLCCLAGRPLHPPCATPASLSLSLCRRVVFVERLLGRARYNAIEVLVYIGPLTLLLLLAGALANEREGLLREVRIVLAHAPTACMASWDLAAGLCRCMASPLLPALTREPSMEESWPCRPLIKSCNSLPGPRRAWRLRRRTRCSLRAPAL